MTPYLCGIVELCLTPSAVLHMFYMHYMNASPCHACNALQPRPLLLKSPACYKRWVVVASRTQTHLRPLQRLGGFMVSQ